jgi:hypothetical protein
VWALVEGEGGGGGGDFPHAGVPPLHPVPHPSEKRYMFILSQLRAGVQYIMIGTIHQSLLNPFTHPRGLFL